VAAKGILQTSLFTRYLFGKENGHCGRVRLSQAVTSPLNHENILDLQTKEHMIQHSRHNGYVTADTYKLLIFPYPSSSTRNPGDPSVPSFHRETPNPPVFRNSHPITNLAKGESQGRSV
jgi:hypothetical protein